MTEHFSFISHPLSFTELNFKHLWSNHWFNWSIQKCPNITVAWIKAERLNQRSVKSDLRMCKIFSSVAIAITISSHPLQIGTVNLYSLLSSFINLSEQSQTLIGNTLSLEQKLSCIQVTPAKVVQRNLSCSDLWPRGDAWCHARWSESLDFSEDSSLMNIWTAMVANQHTDFLSLHFSFCSVSQTHPTA